MELITPPKEMKATQCTRGAEIAGKQAAVGNSLDCTYLALASVQSVHPPLKYPRPDLSISDFVTLFYVNVIFE